MGLMSMFPGGGSTNNQPLKAPTNFVATADGQTSIALTWTDPENEYAQPSGVLIGEWMFTRIVRKTGSAPVNANDGILVVESGIKNQYQTTPYVDTGLISGTVYYYAAFAFTKTRVSSPGAQTSYNLKGYDADLNNNTWDVISLAVREGDAASLWPKGSTKDLVLTDGKIMTMSILAHNPTRYPLSDGSGYPAILFATKHLYYSKSQFYEEPYSTSYYEEAKNSALGYFSSQSSDGIANRLRPFINSIYNNKFPSDVKTYIQSITASYSTVGSGSSSGTAKLFPISSSTYYPTASSRIKRLNNGDGDASDWHTGIMGYYETGRGSEILYNYGTTIVTSSGVFDDEVGMGYSTGVSFGFCFEKAVTS